RAAVLGFGGVNRRPSVPWSPIRVAPIASSGKCARPRLVGSNTAGHTGGRHGGAMSGGAARRRRLAASDDDRRFAWRRLTALGVCAVGVVFFFAGFVRLPGIHASWINYGVSVALFAAALGCAWYLLKKPDMSDFNDTALGKPVPVSPS